MWELNGRREWSGAIVAWGLLGRGSVWTGPPLSYVHTRAFSHATTHIIFTGPHHEGPRVLRRHLLLLALPAQQLPRLLLHRVRLRPYTTQSPIPPPYLPTQPLTEHQHQPQQSQHSACPTLGAGDPQSRFHARMYGKDLAYPQVDQQVRMSTSQPDWPLATNGRKYAGLYKSLGP